MEATFTAESLKMQTQDRDKYRLDMLAPALFLSSAVGYSWMLS